MGAIQEEAIEAERVQSYPPPSIGGQLSLALGTIVTYSVLV